MSHLQRSADPRAALSLNPPVRVSVATSDALGQQESLGTGTLVDKIAVGARVQISLSGTTLRTSVINEVVEVGGGSLEIRTDSRNYRLSRESAGRPEMADAARQRLDQLRNLSRRKPAAKRATTGVSASSHVSTPKTPGSGSFCSGSEVMVTRLRTGDALMEACGPLGRATLMDDLRIGNSARFSLEDGSTIATSPVRSLERTGASRVQFATGNSTYRFNLLQ